MVKNRPVIYVASPYTKGDPCVNANFQMRMFDLLITDGKVWPIVPLWSHFQHTAFPRPYTDWIEYDKAIIHKCDGLIRLNADHPTDSLYLVKESSGADGEEKLAQDLGLPVFRCTPSLYEWVDKTWQ